MAIAWKPIAGSDPAVQKGFVQADDTNEAFTLAAHGVDNFQLESHITGRPNTELFQTAATAEADAKAFAETLIDTSNVPRLGTETIN